MLLELYQVYREKFSENSPRRYDVWVGEGEHRTFFSEDVTGFLRRYKERQEKIAHPESPKRLGLILLANDADTDPFWDKGGMCTLENVSLEDMMEFCGRFGDKVISHRIYKAVRVDLRVGIEKKAYAVCGTTMHSPNFFSFDYFFNGNRFIDFLKAEKEKNPDLIVNSLGDEGPYYDNKSGHSFILMQFNSGEREEIKEKIGIGRFV